MGFLESLAHVFGHKDTQKAGHAYDRTQWRRKLTLTLDRLPESQKEWEPLMADARALNIDPAWIQGAMRSEFDLLIRRAVADSHLTGMEHRKLDLARDLIGLSDEDAEKMLHTAVAEAETFFGKDVEGA